MISLHLPVYLREYSFDQMSYIKTRRQEQKAGANRDTIRKVFFFVATVSVSLFSVFDLLLELNEQNFISNSLQFK